MDIFNLISLIFLRRDQSVIDARNEDQDKNNETKRQKLDRLEVSRRRLSASSKGLRLICDKFLRNQFT